MACERPLARSARVSPSRGGESPKAAGGRSHAISTDDISVRNPCKARTTAHRTHLDGIFRALPSVRRGRGRDRLNLNCPLPSSFLPRRKSAGLNARALARWRGARSQRVHYREPSLQQVRICATLLKADLSPRLLLAATPAGPPLELGRNHYFCLGPVPAAVHGRFEAPRRHLGGFHQSSANSRATDSIALAALRRPHVPG